MSSSCRCEDLTCREVLCFFFRLNFSFVKISEKVDHLRPHIFGEKQEETQNGGQAAGWACM